MPYSCTAHTERPRCALCAHCSLMPLQATDLYPAPPKGAKLALREHYAKPSPNCPGASPPELS